MNQRKKDCECPMELRQVDASGGNATLLCARCGHCTLERFGETIGYGGAFRIRLRDFHRNRRLRAEDPPWKRPLADLSMANRLVADLTLGAVPSAITCCDFGINSTQHLRALQAACEWGVTAYELDRVSGDGPAITGLVRYVVPDEQLLVVFETPYDKYDWGGEEDSAV